MSDPELELMEKELERLRPAAAPERLVVRLEKLGAEARAPLTKAPVPLLTALKPGWKALLRRLAPVAALPILVLAGVWLVHRPAHEVAGPMAKSPVPVASNIVPSPTLSTQEPEQVHIDYRLLAAFETVAEVPGRGPVRFRFSEWEDRVVVRDPKLGFAVERRTPRYEIVPVRYESY
jgi:hypothetical protein